MLCVAASKSAAAGTESKLKESGRFTSKLPKYNHSISAGAGLSTDKGL
jgi:hypothetical protein